MVVADWVETFKGSRIRWNFMQLHNIGTEGFSWSRAEFSFEPQKIAEKDFGRFIVTELWSKLTQKRIVIRGFNNLKKQYVILVVFSPYVERSARRVFKFLVDFHERQNENKILNSRCAKMPVEKYFFLSQGISKEVS